MRFFKFCNRIQPKGFPVFKYQEHNIIKYRIVNIFSINMVSNR